MTYPQLERLQKRELIQKVGMRLKDNESQVGEIVVK